jgi:lipid II isoglutaminyl synthase (glutamine-hydrolysing)
MPDRALTLVHLYADTLNLYGDFGNIAALTQRCAWRGIECRVEAVGIGQPCDFDACDMLFVGGGQDRAQSMVADDLVTRGEEIRRRVDDGMVALTICGGFQLFGRSFLTSDGLTLPGIRVFDAETVAGTGRLIGDIVIDTTETSAEWLRHDGDQTLVGFENHSGHTRLGPGLEPLGRVVCGYGNEGDGAYEGAVYRHALGTYLHGSLLPKNPWLADAMIATALRMRYGDDGELPALDDALEGRAHERAVEHCKAT